MFVPLTFECATASNPFYVPLPFPCRLRSARYVCDQNQGSTKTVVIAKTGGNTIISGDLSATGGTLTNGTVTATDADANQDLEITDTLTVTINLTGGTAGTVVMWLELDEFNLAHQ
jgi:hypothetical protein